MTAAILPGAEAWSADGDGDRAQTGIVVTHGFTGNPSSTRPLAEALAGRGFRVELVRLPGHGTSVRDLAKTRYADWRQEVERAASRLRGRCQHVVLVGLSMGGAICLDVASDPDSTIAGVVTINAPVLDREGLLARLAPQLEKILPYVPASAAGLAKNDIAKGGEENAYAWISAAAGNSFLQQLPRIRAQLKSLGTPLLVAYSPQDHSVPPENSVALARLVPGPVETLVLTRSYHVATLDWDFELLLDRVTRFADRVTSPERAI
ncbi:MAG: alpha/beta fold hydrolase [Polyangiaceae bacterium]